MNRIKKISLFTVVCIVFSSTFLAIGLGIDNGASPLFFAATRFTLAGLLLVIPLILSKKLTPKKVKQLLGRSTFLSIFLTVGTFGFMFLAQTKVDSGFMARLDSIGPIITALLASIFLGKKLTLKHLFAFLLATLGSFLMAAPAVEADPLYFGFAALSVLFYAIGNVIYPRLFKENDDPIVSNSIQSFLGGLILLILAFLTEKVSLPFATLGPLLYLIIGGSIIGHSAALILVRDAGPVFAASWLYVAPVVASFLGFIILNEPISEGGIFGTVIVLLGVLVLDRAENSTHSSSPAPLPDQENEV